MKPLEYVPIERIIENVRRDFDLVDQINVSDVIEWTFYAVGLIGVGNVMTKKVTDGNTDLGHPEPVVVDNYRGALPQGMHSIVQVRDYNTKQALRAAGGSFAVSTNRYNALGYGDFTYMINNSFIFTNMEEGLLEISYLSFPTDYRGYPVIPDDAKYIKAIESYIIERLARREYLNDKLTQEKYRMLEKEWLWYCGAAKQSMLTLSIDEIETMKNALTSFFKKSNYHDSGYESFGQKESISFGRKDRFMSTPFIDGTSEETSIVLIPSETFAVKWINRVCVQENEINLSATWINRLCVQEDIKTITAKWNDIITSGVCVQIAEPIDTSTITAKWINKVCTQVFDSSAFTAGWTNKICTQVEDSDPGLAPNPDFDSAAWTNKICVQELTLPTAKWISRICVQEEEVADATTMTAKWINKICVQISNGEMTAKWVNRVCAQENIIILSSKWNNRVCVQINE